MTENNQKQLGKTLWNIADQLRGAMNADDFRDYLLAFLFLFGRISPTWPGRRTGNC
jgi:type I restriction enzyme M protein